MCESLLESNGKTEQEVCDMRMHTTYHVSSDAAEPDGFIPLASAKTEIHLTWLTEDEI